MRTNNHPIIEGTGEPISKIFESKIFNLLK